MSEPIKLTPTDEALLGQIAGLAERYSEDGVFLHLMHSRSLVQPVLLLVAIGQQALAVQQIIMKNEKPPERRLIEVEKNNGKF